MIGARARGGRRPPGHLTVLLVTLAATVAPVALAQTAGPSEAAGAGVADAHVVVDPDHRFALRLPVGHQLSRSGTQWYVHGFLNGEPLVPDATVALQPGLAAREVIARDFGDGAEVREVALGPGTVGLRVTAEYEAGGSRYRSDTYLIEGPAGTYRIDRYEDFDWPPFDAVARSFHFVTFAGERP